MNRLLFITVVLTILAASLPGAAPASAAETRAPGDMQFVGQQLPTNAGLKLVNGSDIAGIAVSGDGSIIYAVDGAMTGTIYRSTDGGMSFSYVVTPSVASLKHIAVAPDNANAVAVSDGLNVWVSTTGGSSWTALPQPAGPLAGTHTITSVGVGPARSGTLLGREYVITVANNSSGTTTGGDVLIIGGATATWESALPATEANLNDYMAVKFSPTFIDDRALVAIGSGAVAGDVQVVVLNTASITAPGTRGTLVIAPTVLPATSPVTIDFTSFASTNNIVKGSIALPSNFDARTAPTRRSYAGFASYSNGGVTTGAADNDVYRVDDTAATRLSALPGAGVYSLSYAGTIASGTLFMGRESTADVRFTTNPTAASPTWTATSKVLPVANSVVGTPWVNGTIVVVPPNFATSNTVYLGTAGPQSGFGKSTDGGVTFNQTALIDYGDATNTIVNDENIALTPDGATMFMATRVTVGSVRWLSLWKSATPVYSNTWTRIFAVPMSTLAGRGDLRLSPDYATSNCLYLFDKSTNGFIYRSTNGGDTFSSRLQPAGVLISTPVLEDSSILYVTDGGPTPGAAGALYIYKSFTGGNTWETPTAPNVGPIRTLLVPQSGQLLVGGLGNIAYSTDGGSTFTRYAGPNPGESYRIARSASFATDHTIFLSDAAGATGAVYRFAIGTDPTFVDLLSPGAMSLLIASGIGIKNGVLYVARSAGSVDRTFYPMAPAGQQQWGTLNVASPPLAALSQITVVSPGNTVYLRDSNVTVWAMADNLATAKPRITSPADNSTVPIDPVYGRAEQITLLLEAMGSGPGLVTAYEVEIAEKAFGWAAGVRSAPIIVNDPTSPAIIVGSASYGYGFGFTMLANRAYLVRVRAAGTVGGEDARSQWSDPINLYVGALTPIVTTGTATAVAGTSATLNGSLNDSGTSPSVLVSFEWGLTAAYGQITPPVSMNATGAFSFNLTGLSPNTTYHFRTRAMGSEALYGGNPTGYGADRTFTTSASIPDVTTVGATNLTANSALLHGVLNNPGSAGTVAVSFEWGLSTAYDHTTATVNVTAAGAFSAPVTGLTPGATYHFRAKAMGDGTSYGADRTFITPVSGSPLSAVRHLPALVSRAQTFTVTINFAVPSDNFTSLALADVAPAGWNVSGNTTACVPAADWDSSAGNRAEYVWYSSNYTSGTGFAVSYNVTVPAGAVPGSYSFTGGFLEYYNGAGAGPFMAEIAGDLQVQVPVIEGMVYQASGVVLGGVTVTMDSATSVVGDGSGGYRIGAASVGAHTLVAGKTGFRNQTQTLNIAAPGTTYVLDFKGNSGLVPNAPDLSYVLACINKWKFPTDGLGLSLSKVLSVINAWKFPLP